MSDTNQTATPPVIPVVTAPQPPNIFKLKVSNFINSTSKQKRIIGGIAGILLLAGALGVGSYLVQQQQITSSQAGAAVLSLNTTSASPKVGSTFTVAVALDTKGLAVSAADIRVRYETAKLEAVSIVPFGNFLPVVLDPINGTQGTIDLATTSEGRASIVLGALVDAAGAHPRSGTGILAQVTFKVKASGPTTISFGGSSAVAAVGQSSDVAGTKNSLQITVPGSVTPVPTPKVVTSPPQATPVSTPKLTPKPTTKPTCLQAGSSCLGPDDGRCCSPNVCRNPHQVGFSCSQRPE